jgi:CRISPR-associated protein Cas2
LACHFFALLRRFVAPLSTAYCPLPAAYYPMHLIVCYDIVSDRRRGRLMRRLREHLTRVQKSVFEGPLDEERLVRLRAMIMEEIDPVEDTVRVYHLCGRCQPATGLLGTSLFVDTEEPDEVY